MKLLKKYDYNNFFSFKLIRRGEKTVLWPSFLGERKQILKAREFEVFNHEDINKKTLMSYVKKLRNKEGLTAMEADEMGVYNEIANTLGVESWQRLAENNDLTSFISIERTTRDREYWFCRMVPLHDKKLGNGAGFFGGKPALFVLPSGATDRYALETLIESIRKDR